MGRQSKMRCPRSFSECRLLALLRPGGAVHSVGQLSWVLLTLEPRRLVCIARCEFSDCAPAPGALASLRRLEEASVVAATGAGRRNCCVSPAGQSEGAARRIKGPLNAGSDPNTSPTSSVHLSLGFAQQQLSSAVASFLPVSVSPLQFSLELDQWCPRLHTRSDFGLEQLRD